MAGKKNITKIQKQQIHAASAKKTFAAQPKSKIILLY